MRGIIVGGMNLVSGVSWISEVIWGSSKDALVFFHRAGGVYPRCLLALSVFTFLQLRRAEGEGIGPSGLLHLPFHCIRYEKRVAV